MELICLVFRYLTTNHSEFFESVKVLTEVYPRYAAVEVEYIHKSYQPGIIQFTARNRSLIMHEQMCIAETLIQMFSSGFSSSRVFLVEMTNGQFTFAYMILFRLHD